MKEEKNGNLTLTLMVKTLGMIAVLMVCIIVFPLSIAVLGGAFGIVVGVLGAVFGAIIGAFGAVFGAVFGIFESLFDWRWHFDFFDCNVFTIGIVAIIIALAIRSREQNQNKKNTR